MSIHLLNSIFLNFVERFICFLSKCLKQLHKQSLKVIVLCFSCIGISGVFLLLFLVDPCCPVFLLTVFLPWPLAIYLPVGLAVSSWDLLGLMGLCDPVRSCWSPQDSSSRSETTLRFDCRRRAPHHSPFPWNWGLDLNRQKAHDDMSLGPYRIP